MGCPLLIYRCLCAELHVRGCTPIIVNPGVFGLAYLLFYSYIVSTPDCSLCCILGRVISEYVLTYSNTPKCELKAAVGTKLACSSRKQFYEQMSSVSSQEPPRYHHGCRQPSWRPLAVVKTALLCWSEGVLDFDCWWSCWNSMPSPKGEGCKPLTEDTVL